MHFWSQSVLMINSVFISPPGKSTLKRNLRFCHMTSLTLGSTPQSGPEFMMRKRKKDGSMGAVAGGDLGAYASLGNSKICMVFPGWDKAPFFFSFSRISIPVLHLHTPMVVYSTRHSVHISLINSVLLQFRCR